MAKQGFFGGNPQAVMQAPADVVQSIIEYDHFEMDYKSEFSYLNKKEGGGQ